LASPALSAVGAGAWIPSDFQCQVHVVVGNTQHGLVIAKPWEIRLTTNLISQGSALHIFLYLIIVFFREMFSA